MIRRSSVFLMGLLIFLAFVWQSAFLAESVGVRLDLLAVLVAVSAYRWEVRGGLLAGIWSGLLASTLNPSAPLKVVFLYASFGLIASLLFDSALSEGSNRRAVLALALSCAFFLFEGALFASHGLSVLPHLSLNVLAANAALLFLVLESASWIPLDPQSDRRGRGHDMVRGIVG
jgi:hypothetical protein